MKINKLLIIFALFFFVGTTAFAAGPNPTTPLSQGTQAPWTGFLVDQQRIEKSIRISQELDYQRKLNELQQKYYEEKEKNAQLAHQLELEKEKKQAAVVEDALKKELSKKSVWYKQWYITIPTTIAAMVFLRTYIP
jgi:hypothetical protein